MSKNDGGAKHTPGPWHWNGIATVWNTTGRVGEVEREVMR